jgi:hypothetical protein
MGDDALPAKMQAALFKKILAYDRKLADRPARVGVFSGSDEDAAAEMVDAFRQVGLQAAKVKAADLDRPAPAFDVLYQMPGSATGRLGGACVRLSLLSLAGEAAPADAGSVSVGLGTRDDGRPEIVIHLARVKQEGHEFPAELLRLARIVH